VQIVADRSGAKTGDAAGDVIIDGDGNLVAAIITGSPYVTVDGFIIRGVAPTDAASAVLLRVRGQSDNVTLRNCVVTNTEPADGIRIDSSSNVLAFNNLVYSADRGIIVTGAADGVALINNTVALSQRAALSVRTSGGNSPQGVVATNCLFQSNGSGAAIDDGGTGGYSGDYNLVFQPDAEDQTADYDPASLRGANDVNVDAQLVAPDAGDFHLQPNSPAIDAGSDAIDDALNTALAGRSTTADGALDSPPPDIGYHYPP
jgi:parallel beta-helix repeat protein